MHDYLAAELLKEVRELIAGQREENKLLREILHELKHPRKPNRVTGGNIKEITMVPISPGNSPKFQVTPTFSGDPFVLDGSKAAVSSSDPVNFPVSLDLTNDAEGRTFVAPIPADAIIVGGSEVVTVTWTYTNVDGVVATVSGTVTEVGIVDDVTGGTFAQVA
jgi:hypothetical protein